MNTLLGVSTGCEHRPSHSLARCVRKGFLLRCWPIKAGGCGLAHRAQNGPHINHREWGVSKPVCFGLMSVVFLFLSVAFAVFADIAPGFVLGGIFAAISFSCLSGWAALMVFIFIKAFKEMDDH